MRQPCGRRRGERNRDTSHIPRRFLENTRFPFEKVHGVGPAGRVGRGGAVIVAGRPGARGRPVLMVFGFMARGTTLVVAAGPAPPRPAGRGRSRQRRLASTRVARNLSVSESDERRALPPITRRQKPRKSNPTLTHVDLRRFVRELSGESPRPYLHTRPRCVSAVCRYTR